MKFSFIIPCYNTAQYLEKCLNSIIDQTFKDWEIIAVNDGSIDDTSGILNDYLKRDSRIKVITQENKGVSASRNNGVKIARGEYLLFADSDDWYKDVHGLERIVEISSHNDEDIIVFQYQSVMEKKENYGEVIHSYFSEMADYEYTGEAYLYTVLSRAGGYAWMPWNYAFKREFWITNHFQFDEKLWIAEDTDILYRAILKAQKIKVLDCPIYQYRVREDSTCHSISSQSMKVQLSSCIKNINMVNKMDIKEDLKILLNNNFVVTYFVILSLAYYLNKNDREEIMMLLDRNQYLMRYAITGNNRIIRAMVQNLGIRITSWLLFIRLKYVKRIDYQ